MALGGKYLLKYFHIKLKNLEDIWGTVSPFNGREGTLITGC